MKKKNEQMKIVIPFKGALSQNTIRINYNVLIVCHRPTQKRTAALPIKIWSSLTVLHFAVKYNAKT